MCIIANLWIILVNMFMQLANMNPTLPHSCVRAIAALRNTAENMTITLLYLGR